jgi:predicted GNAT family acetyltransferase
MTREVQDNPAMRRYELTIAGTTAFVQYRLDDNAIALLHTEVPSELAGQGVGSALVKGVLDAARERGLKVVPRCAFVANYIERRPEYQDLLA